MKNAIYKPFIIIKIIKISSLLCLLILFSLSLKAQSEYIEVTLLQINDVYEIDGLEGGLVGGMSRIATLKKQLLKENPNTLLVLAGDFVNPSAMGEAVFQGKKLKGRQMVDVLNRCGMDLVNFGNHEFDLKIPDLQDRLNESHFDWVSSNCHQVTDRSVCPECPETMPFYKFQEGQKSPIPTYKVLEFYGNTTGSLKIGVIAPTLNENEPSYVKINDFIAESKTAYAQVKDQCDLLIGLTHLSLAQNQKLAQAIPDLKLVISGHEHVLWVDTTGTTLMYNADANAKTAFVHRIRFNPSNKDYSIKTQVIQIDEKIPEDPGVQKVVDQWTEIVFEGFRKQGFDPDEIIATIKDSLDGREANNRINATNMGTLIAKSMQDACPTATFAVLNAGSIRIDDLVRGAISQYDIIRILPFGGATVTVKMEGKLLSQFLDLGMGESLHGNGAFLQTTGIEKQKDIWLINGKKIKKGSNYIFAAGDYLMAGETAYKQLLADNKNLYTVSPANGPLQLDLRKGLIEYMKKQ